MKSKFIAGAAFVLLASTSAFAGNVTQFSLPSPSIGFVGAFSETFDWTTANTYDAAKANLYVTGLTTNFSKLTISVYDANNTLVSTPHSFSAGTVQLGTGNLKATFLDSSVPWNLLAKQTYKVVVTGTTLVKDSTLALTGTYFKTGTAGVITAVPEPESYAMFLAGLGLMGAIAKRRKAKQA